MSVQRKSGGKLQSFTLYPPTDPIQHQPCERNQRPKINRSVEILTVLIRAELGGTEERNVLCEA